MLVTDCVKHMTYINIKILMVVTSKINNKMFWGEPMDKQNTDEMTVNPSFDWETIDGLKTSISIPVGNLSKLVDIRINSNATVGISC